MAEGPEKKFQHHIEHFLQQEHKYAVLEQAEITDTEYYFAEDHLYAFLQATQQDTLARLEKNYSSDSRYEIFKSLKEELQRRPLWCILRNGLTVRGHVFKLYFPQPRSSESVANRYYRENRISFRSELVIKGGKRPDIVFFLNGLPIIILELKHEKNENVHDAVTQYAKRDHSDRIFQLPFLYIAADTSEVMVATDPRRESNFRWYNTGLSNKAITEGEYPVEYLYREVLSKKRLLEAISFFLVLAPGRLAGEGKPEQQECTLFPRYHQGRCVVNVADAISEHFVHEGNVGRKFLINHSAGSGKTLTICWLADRLHSLYKPGTNEKIFDMIFLLTDRKSLDKNIRDDMEKFAHLKYVVQFAGKSADLACFLRDREQIIVTTQQKFKYILDKIAGDNSLHSLRVAFLIDEAHRSQEGKTASAIRTPFRDGLHTSEHGEDLPISTEVSPDYRNLVAGDKEQMFESVEVREKDEPDVEDVKNREDPQDTINNVIREHDLNQTFVAFTATPAPATVQLFGEPFDTYSEAEAIEEGYIVDVAQSIISFKTLYNLHCPIVPGPEEEKLYPPGIVSKALKNLAFQDAELVQYKAEVMLRIFDEQIKPLIGGRAKAMIVSTSRIGGLLYYEIIKEKLKERNADYKVLYAFSNFVHPETNKTYSEHELNNLQPGELIEDRFEQDEYRIMVVASKFQTGFDQPLLAGMFLDKPVADRNAVQTVSRLNRCHAGKENVVVVDFTNNAKVILQAFNKYRHGSPHEPEEPDEKKCFDLYREIIDIGVFEQDEAEGVVRLIKAGDDAKLQAEVDRMRRDFRILIDDFEERKAYVYLLTRFVKSYHFLSRFYRYPEHIVDFVAFAEYVGPQLIKQGSVSELMRLVRATIVEKAAVKDEGIVDMSPGKRKLKSRTGGGEGGAPPKKVSVQDMIKKIREKFAISEDEALLIREVTQEKIEDRVILQTVATHCDDRNYLDTVFMGQVNGKIQDAYTKRQRYESLVDPKYIDTGAIFDIMAHTVIQHGLELAEAA